MRHRAIIAVGVLCVLLPQLGLAAGWYGDLGVAFDFANDMSLDGERAKFDIGLPVGSLAVGRQLGDRWRVELEWAYRDNDLEVLFSPDTGEEIRPDRYDGIKVQSFSLNALRELRLGALRPYFGVGIGPARVDVRMGDATNGGIIIRPTEPILDDDAWVLGLQAIGGFTVPVARRLDLAFDYRLWHTPSMDVAAVNGEALDLDHTIHSISAHVRYLFSGQGSQPPAELRSRDAGWYLTGSLGTGAAVDADLHDSLDSLDAFQVGPFFSLAVGVGIGSRWRAELEAARRANDVEMVDFTPVNGQFRAIGDVEATSLMANVLYRFWPDRAIRPFIGVGAGLTYADYQVQTRGEPYLDDEDTAPALQLILGVDVALAPRLDFTADFRSWYTDWLALTRPDGTSVELPHSVHSVSVGLRYSM
jgi:opacity protein-like surface antigen